jgi:hypothetical protein
MNRPAPRGRNRVDLVQLPKWAPLLDSLATVAVVAGLALLFGNRGSSPAMPVSASVAGLIAFAVVAWRDARCTRLNPLHLRLGPLRRRHRGIPFPGPPRVTSR